MFILFTKLRFIQMSCKEFLLFRPNYDNNRPNSCCIVKKINFFKPKCWSGCIDKVNQASTCGVWAIKKSAE
jgi:hypothetical protein